MNTKAQIKKMEKGLDILQSIARAFEHTATKKMQINKKDLEDLGSYLGEVKQTYFNAKISFVKKPNEANFILNSAVRKTSKKRIVILITSEPIYYGQLLPYMVEQFLKEASEVGTDSYIIGIPGKEEVDKRNMSKISYKYFDFDDERPNWQVISRLSSVVMDYEEIQVIFAKYRSILKQDVVKEDLGKEVKNGSAGEVKKYLIKPDTPTALSYLEKQIVTNQLLQKMYENGLAKSAIRVRILEIGEIAERLTETMEKFEKLKVKFAHEVNNRKLANLYGSRDVWQSESIFKVYR